MQIDPPFRQPGLVVTIATLVSAGAIGLFYVSLERQRVKGLDAERAQLVVALVRTDNQIRDISARLDTLAAQTSSHPVEPAHTTRRDNESRPRSSEYKQETARLQKLQAQVLRQQKELAQARAEIATNHENLMGQLNTTREDLQGKLNSTKDELSGSIAKNHDEMVILQKRGERNYYEFDLAKSKEPRRVGPISLALRKSDTKRKNYTVDLLIEDSRIEKKNVNLYEPVLINLADRPQPLDIVVNFIGKNEVKGYVSEPKYKRSQLAEGLTTPIASPNHLNNR